MELAGGTRAEWEAEREELEQQLRQHTERVEELRRAQLSLLSQLNPHSAGQDQRIERVRLAAVTGKWATPPKPRRPRRKPKPKPKPARASPRKAATPKRRRSSNCCRY